MNCLEWALGSFGLSDNLMLEIEKHANNAVQFDKMILWSVSDQQVLGDLGTRPKALLSTSQILRHDNSDIIDIFQPGHVPEKRTHLISSHIMCYSWQATWQTISAKLQIDLQIWNQIPGSITPRCIDWSSHANLVYEWCPPPCPHKQTTRPNLLMSITRGKIGYTGSFWKHAYQEWAKSMAMPLCSPSSAYSGWAKYNTM